MTTRSPSKPAVDRRLHALTEQSDRAGLQQAAGHGALLLFTGYLVATASRPGWQLLAMICHGIVLVFLFAPLHECIHRTAFRQRRLNDTLSLVCGLLVILPPKYFRAFHLAHHRYTQNPDKDPELASPKPATLAAYLLYLSGLRYWAEQFRWLAGASLGRVKPDFVRQAKQAGLIREARLFLLLYAALVGLSIVTQNDILLWVWLLPALLGQPFLRAFLVAEHTLCPEVPDMYDNTRTTYTNPLVRFLCWNMCFHTEHHVHAGIPFHRLPEANRVVRERLRHTGNGYLAVNLAVCRELTRAT